MILDDYPQKNLFFQQTFLKESQTPGAIVVAAVSRGMV
jgi:hypothetical protein